MTVKRIVANMAADRIDIAKAFYGDALGMTVVMDLGWIATFAADGGAAQISVATEGGSGTPVPDISIEVDDLAVEPHFHLMNLMRGIGGAYQIVLDLFEFVRDTIDVPLERGELVGDLLCVMLLRLHGLAGSSARTRSACPPPRGIPEACRSKPPYATAAASSGKRAKDAILA